MSVYICRQSSPVEVDLIDITVSLRLKDHQDTSCPVRLLNLYIRLSSQAGGCQSAFVTKRK